jgi:hypothetical protein
MFFDLGGIKTPGGMIPAGVFFFCCRKIPYKAIAGRFS